MLVAEQGLLSARSGSPREEQARQAARARTRDLEFAWASFLSHAMQQGAIPKNDPRLLTRAILGLYNSIWHWYRPNGIVALNRIAEFFTDRSLALIGVRPDAQESREGRSMSFFERYFAALDGPDPHSSLELVADDVEFSIQWARGADRASRQLVGGRAELRAFIDAGDMSGWAHHVLFGGGGDDVEFALGETRYDRRRADRDLPRGGAARRRRADGRATWSPARRRSPSSRRGSMPLDFVPVADGLLAGSRGGARADRLRVPALRRRRLPAPGLVRGVHVERRPASAGSPAAGRCGPGRSSASRPSRRRTPARPTTSSRSASATSSSRARCASRRG